MLDCIGRHGQPWRHKGPDLAEMFAGLRMKRIPRELRRIYAPYP